MLNLEIRNFSQAIINFVNQSSIPIEIKRLCICDIAAQLQVAADEQIHSELLEIQEERDEPKKDTSSHTLEK